MAKSHRFLQHFPWSLFTIYYNLWFQIGCRQHFPRSLSNILRSLIANTVGCRENFAHQSTEFVDVPTTTSRIHEYEKIEARDPSYTKWPAQGLISYFQHAPVKESDAASTHFANQSTEFVDIPPTWRIPECEKQHSCLLSMLDWWMEAFFTRKKPTRTTESWDSYIQTHVCEAPITSTQNYDHHIFIWPKIIRGAIWRPVYRGFPFANTCNLRKLFKFPFE
jgi:hypothetical protein